LDTETAVTYDVLIQFEITGAYILGPFIVPQVGGGVVPKRAIVENRGTIEVDMTRQAIATCSRVHDVFLHQDFTGHSHTTVIRPADYHKHSYYALRL